MISDYSFYGVNDDTVPLAPPEAMQFGQTLKRILQRIHRANDVFGPVYMFKIDLSDGFYPLWLRLEDTLKLVVLFLSRRGEAFLVQIVAHFNSPFPQPVPWQICNLRKPMNSSLILALSKKQCAMQLLLPTPHERLLIGRSGVTSALVTKLIPSSEISQIPFPTCKSLRPDTETVDFPQVVDPSGLKWFLTPFFLLHRN